MALPDPPEHLPISDGLRSRLPAVDEEMHRIAAAMVKTMKEATSGAS